MIDNKGVKENVVVSDARECTTLCGGKRVCEIFKKKERRLAKESSGGDHGEPAGLLKGGELLEYTTFTPWILG